jgi:hypothetical protein
MAGRILFFVAMLLATTLAHAQVRAIPEAAKRGEMRHVQAMIVAIDGAAQQLSPGAQIRDAANRIIVPAAIPEGSLVKYLLDTAGLVHRVWILTPEEAAQRDNPR